MKSNDIGLVSNIVAMRSIGERTEHCIELYLDWFEVATNNGLNEDLMRGSMI